MSRHINAKKDQISPYILISGNPERTKWAAETFLDQPKLVNTNRLNYIYTGMYQGVRVSLATSGMGIPSFKIYAIELIQDYKAKVIIRTGTAGNLNHDFKVFDVAVIDSATLCPKFEKDKWTPTRVSYPDFELFKKTVDVAEQIDQKIIVGGVFSSNNFYEDLEEIRKCTDNGKFMLVDMETAALFSLGNILKCQTGALLMISNNIGFDSDADSNFDDRVRKTGEMFKLGLETLVAASKK